MIEKNEIVDNTAGNRFELPVGDLTAFLDYRRNPGRMTLVHTEVPVDLRGQGVGSRLVRHALDTARKEGRFVLILCSFAKSYVADHPEYQDLLRKQEAG